MKKIISLVLCFSFASLAFGQESEPAESFQYKNTGLKDWWNDGDPFVKKLDMYEGNRNFGQTVMFWSGVGAGLGFLSASVFKTGTSMKIFPQDLGTIGEISSGAAIGVCGVGFFLGLIQWMTNANSYQDTLRLQAQYYNLIHR